MNLLGRIFPQRNSAEEEEYQPLDQKRLARLRWALHDELERMGQGPNTDPHPRPLVLVRQARNADGSWPSQSSWIGGLPRLGRCKWPKAEDGSPLPFVAQMSLADIAAICPESPLPETGSLAFFLGDGGVCHVEAANPKETRHPRGKNAPDQIPYWPLEPMVLEMPPELRIYHDADRHQKIREAQGKLLSLIMPQRKGTFSVGNLRRSGACSFDRNFWQGPILLSAMFGRTLASLNHAVDEQKHWLEHARVELSELEAAQYRDDTRIAELEHGIADVENDLPYQQSAIDSFKAFCDSFAELSDGKDPWKQMGKDDYEPVLEKLSEAHGRFDHMLLPGTPCNLEEMQDMVIRSLMSGDAKAFRHMPEDVLAIINAECRLTLGTQHQMFGLGHGQPDGFEDGEDNLLLFQLAPDDMLETDLHGVDAWQFWIARDDAAEGNWDKVKLRVRAR